MLHLCLNFLQSRVDLIAPLSLHVTCDDDSVRAAVVSTCRVVAEADWKQRLGISATVAAIPASPLRRTSSSSRTSVNSSSSTFNLRGSAASSSMRSSFRCEIIRKFATVIGIWGDEGSESSVPELTRASVGYRAFSHVTPLAARRVSVCLSRYVQAIMAVLPEESDRGHVAGEDRRLLSPGCPAPSFLSHSLSLSLFCSQLSSFFV